jgi:lipoxygenase
MCFVMLFQVSAAFDRFSAKLTDIDDGITKRNADLSLKNRLGAARLAYELLRPKSEQGVTAKGIPNSITI